MARLLINSFNHGHRAGDFTEFTSASSPSPEIVSGIADMEGLCLKLLSQSARAAVYFLSKKTELYLRWLHKGDGSMNNIQLELCEDSSVRLYLKWSGAPNNEFYLTVNGTDRFGNNSSHSYIEDGHPVWIELYFLAGTSTGKAQMRINGELIIDFTGNVGTGAGVNRVRWGTSFAQYPHSYYDHFVIDDANQIGFSKVKSLFTSGIGSSTQFTPSTSPNWECVNEAATEASWAPNLESDYNHINSVDQKDFFAHEDLPAEAAGVKCVALRTRAFKNGAPTPTNITPLIKTGGSEYSGDNVVAAAISNHGNKIWETNPNTVNPWTPAEVNALEVGYKSAA